MTIKGIGVDMMKTKQEYQEALNGMEEVYYNFDGCMSAMSMFKEGVNLLTGLINERRYRSGEESWHRGSVVAKKK